MAEKRERRAVIRTRIWDDGDWKARSPLAQWLYMLLLSQASLNQAGVLDLTMKRWGNGAAGAADVLRPAMDELAAARFIVIDWDTEEVLIRTYIRNDEVWKMPNVLKCALREAQQVHSAALRRELAIELRRIGLPSTVEVADLLIQGLPKGSDNPSRNPSSNPSPNPSDNGSPKPSVDRSANPSANPSESEPFPEPFGEPLANPRGEGERVSSSSLVSSNSSSISSSEIAARPRPDVEELCQRLAERIRANGAKATITERWRADARLLLDRDGRKLDEALRLADWATGHSFWRANVLSASAFRKQYDRLLLQAREEYAKRHGGPQAPRGSTTDARVAAAEALKQNPDPRILALGQPTMPRLSLALPDGEAA